MTSTNHPQLASLEGQLIVSCQAYPGEPMNQPFIMAAVAESVVLAGAAGIRVQGLDDLTAVRTRVSVPLIGLVKIGESGVYITPTLDDARTLARAGADIVAMDGTSRPRPDGGRLTDSIAAVHQEGKLVMADCASVADAEYSIAAGADCVATTLSGYTSPTLPPQPGPDLDLLSNLVRTFDVPVIAEGRIHTPADAIECLDRGAHAVVVGSAITHPMRICQRFTAAMSTDRGSDPDAPRGLRKVTETL